VAFVGTYKLSDIYITLHYIWIDWWVLPVEIWASSNRIVREVFGRLLASKIFQRVGPKQVTHGTKRSWFFEPVQLQNEVGQLLDNWSTKVTVQYI